MYSSHRGAPGGAKSATAWITSLHVAGENNLAVFNSDRQTGKFNSLSNFLVPVIRYVVLITILRCYCLLA